MQINSFSISVYGVCLAFSFLLSGMEAGVLALSRLRIRQQMRAGNPAAALLHRYLENTENFLWTIQVGNTVANFVIISLTIVGLYDLLNTTPLLFSAAFAVFLFLFYAFFDLLPKMLFRVYPNRLSLLMVHPFRLIHLTLSPLVALMERCSERLLHLTNSRQFKGHLFGNRDELRFMMQESGGSLSSEEKQMINRVLDLQNLTVRQVMIPLAKTVTIKQKDTLAEMLRIGREKQMTRLPVWDAAAQPPRIIGMASLNNVLFKTDLDPARPVKDFVKPALYLDGEVRLEVALQRMQRAGQRLAIVLGRNQREIGVVSLQDILKFMFGEVSL